MISVCNFQSDYNENDGKKIVRFTAWVNINIFIEHHHNGKHPFFAFIVHIYGIWMLPLWSIRSFHSVTTHHSIHLQTNCKERTTKKKVTAYNAFMRESGKKHCSVFDVSQINISCYAIMTLNKDERWKKWMSLSIANGKREREREKLHQKIINGKLSRKLLVFIKLNSVKGNGLFSRRFGATKKNYTLWFHLALKGKKMVSNFPNTW